ncbi:MAG: hypothetical protein KY468_15755 [Armatimonadetes bacterium]|nr:hypothetical protein [Armatimonadota bacterium]
MNRLIPFVLTFALLVCLSPQTITAQKETSQTGAAAEEKIPPTRYYPLTVGNRWSYNFRRKTNFTMNPQSGQGQNFDFTSTGTQNVEIVREDGERSGSEGKVYVQKATEVMETSSGEGDPGETPSTEPRLIGELYFRLNDRGIWVIADGEPGETGNQIARVNDRRLPLLWVPADLKPGKSWIITSQIDDTVTARITARAGKAQSLRVNGTTYQNVIPVVSLADRMSGRLDLGIAQAPISGGRIVDLTWYAPGVGVVRSHQLANFELEPPNAAYTSASAHFEETQELQPGPRVR